VGQRIFLYLLSNFDMPDEDGMTPGEFLPETARIRNHSISLFRARIIGREGSDKRGPDLWSIMKIICPIEVFTVELVYAH
jgi:hypothetical protein